MAVPSKAKADKELTVFDVRKTLTLTEDAPVFRDFYINGGKESGLKAGMLVTVTRRVSLYDHFQNRSPGELVVPVGRLKLIHVQNGISVARLFSKLSRKNTPILDYNYIMVGDKLDLGSVEMDRGKSKKSVRIEKAAEVRRAIAQAEMEKVQAETEAKKTELIGPQPVKVAGATMAKVAKAEVPKKESSKGTQNTVQEKH